MVTGSRIQGNQTIRVLSVSPCQRSTRIVSKSLHGMTKLKALEDFESTSDLVVEAGRWESLVESDIR